jgi:hypothetical protein
MDGSHIELAQTFADIAQELEKQPSLEATVDEAVRQAVDVVPGCDFAGVSWLQDKQPIETIASTDEIATLLDKAQFELGEGPSVESLWDGDTCLVEDMQARDPEPAVLPATVAAADQCGTESVCA